MDRPEKWLNDFTKNLFETLWTSGAYFKNF